MKNVCGIIFICFVGGWNPAFAADLPPHDGHPPIAVVRPVTEDYYGTKVSDPYRYFENLADPEVQAWIKGQANYAAKTLGSIHGRDALLARIRELDEGAPYRISIVRRWQNGDLHYLKRLASENLDKLYFRSAADGRERLLVDPEKMARSPAEHFALEFCQPSPDRRYVAYGVAASGSEQTVLHVLDCTSGKELPDVIDRMESEYTPPYWLPDGSGFVYSRRRKLPADAPPTEIYKRTRSFLHRLGGDPDRDPVVFGNDASATPMAEGDFPSIVLTPGSLYAIGKIKHGDANELTLYAMETASLGAAGSSWKRICDVDQQVESFAVHGDDVYLRTAQQSPRYKVVRTSLKAPDFDHADTVVPSGSVVVERIDAARDALYVGLMDAGMDRVARVSYDQGARVERLDVPADASSIYLTDVHPDCDGALIGSDSWTRAGKLFQLDHLTRKLTDTGLRPRGTFDDVPGYESEEVQVPSHDGVRVPLSIIHKTGIALDGSHPALISGYGAYGFNSSVHFNPANLAWLERGGVLAIAHVRGGGEFGKQWHLAGQKSTKPNTWKDFLACCEYLVQKRYTSPPKLAGMGGSAGGILIGRSITERPDLFAAAIIHVGMLDTVRSETTTNGVPNIPEFGTVATREGFDGLLEMSAYQQVRDGVKYPAVLLTHGINDPRVEPWMSAKMTARLQAATASGKPVLFRVDYQAGHGIGSTKTQRQKQLADVLAFLLWQMGEQGFESR